jgi:hypothetical protein
LTPRCPWEEGDTNPASAPLHSAGSAGSGGSAGSAGSGGSGGSAGDSTRGASCIWRTL